MYNASENDQNSLSSFSGVKWRDLNRKYRRTKRKLKLLLLAIVVSALTGGIAGLLGASLIPPVWRTGDTIIRRISQDQVFEEEQLVIEVAKQSSPAVVSIVATKDLSVVQQRGSPFLGDFCDDPFFRQFFNCQEEFPLETPGSPRTQKRQVGAGSGFVVSAAGLVVTNKHVVDIEKADFTVLTNDGKKYPAKILSVDPFHDLAIMKISGNSPFPTLPLGDSEKLEIGQTVIAIGNALGEFSNTVSRGVISGLSRSIVASSGASSERLEKLIQTDAAINPGNSGGPLLNLRGEVIGMNTAIAQGAQNIGFAIPVQQVKKAVKDVSTIGRIVYPYLGVRYVMITPAIKENNKLGVDQGAWISSGQNGVSGVIAGSPAEKAGLLGGDVILEINGQKIGESNDLAKVIQSFKVDDTVTLKVFRGGGTRIFRVRLEERKL